MNKIKGLTALILSGFIAFGAMGCNSQNESSEKEPDVDVSTPSNYSLTFENENGKYLAVIKDEGKIVSKTQYPVKIKIKTSSSKEDFSFKEYQLGYDEINDNRATATLTTENGSIFEIQDKYSKNTGGYKVEREIVILNAAHGDYGYQSIYSMASEGSSFDYFIPGMLYKNTDFSRSGTLFSDIEVQRIYTRETRTGLPMVMLRDKQSGYAISLAHIKAQIKSGGVGVGSETANDNMKFGSLGYSFTDQNTVDFCYPGAEGYTKDEKNSTWSNPYHEVKKSGGHSYTLSILVDKNANYRDAMMQSYLTAYEQQGLEIFNDIDINEVYQENVKIFKNEFKVYNSSSSREVVGYDFEYYLPNAKGGGQSLQMGFVGQQCYAGFQLLKYGYEYNDNDCIQKGEKIIDFWVDICESYTLPCVWWEPLNNEIGGKPFVDGSKVYPVFIRCLVDGMDGILEGYKCAKENGKEHKNWYNALIKVADHLCNVQNSDGSFYRAYDYMTGKVSTNKTQAKYQCDSKLNTPIAINFMAKMYELTKDAFYKESALLAADYVYDEIYLKYGKFVGGTPDNPNVTDKEAAVFAMEGFLSAYFICDNQEKKQKYLEACEFSAVCAMSWVYTYDFIVPSETDNLDAINPFLNGGTTGFSLIALGHSAADTFISFAYAEYFKLYAITGNELYLNMAGILQNNTKQVTDFDGRMGYKYSAMSIEASNIHDFSFRTASGGVWLPWIGVANLNGISEMNKMFNEADVLVAKNLQNIKATVESYGCGGKLS